MTAITPLHGPAPAVVAPTAPVDAAAFSASLRRFITLGQMAGTTATPAPGWGPTAALTGPTAGVPPTASATTAAPGGAGRGEAVVAAAKRYLGVPYRWGGTNPATGLDCSGFVQRAFADLGVPLPRVSVDQARQGTKVASLAEAQPGDLVFRRGSPNHIGIYLGDGRFVHAPRTGDVVKVAPLRWTPDEIRRIA